MGYTAAQAARITGCTPSQVRHWSASGLVSPSGEPRRYEFRDLVALRLIRSLLDAGLPSGRARHALRALLDAGGDLAAVRLVTDGRHVWVCRDDGEILDALASGQLALFVAVDRLAADVESEVRAFDEERAQFVRSLVAGAARPASAAEATAS